jgi:hypothetical protein
MNTKDTKRIWFSYVPRDYQAMITILEEQALQGWRLKKMHQYTAVMERIEPKEIKYYADFFTENSYPDYPSHPKFREWLLSKREAGYAFAAQKGQLILFHNDTELQPTQAPLTKKELESKLLNSNATSPMLIILLAFPIIAWMLLYQLFVDSVTFYPLYFGYYEVFFSNFMLVLNALLPPLVLAPLFIGEINKFFFMRRLEKSLQEGTEFIHQTVAQAKRKVWLKDIPLIIFGVLFFGSAIISGSLGISFYILATLLFIGSWLIEKSELKRMHKGILMGIMVFSFNMFAFSFNTSQDLDMLTPETAPKDYPLITLADFGISNESQDAYFRYRERGSILVPKAIEYSEYAPEDYLHLDIYECVSSDFADYLYKRITSGFSKAIQIEKGHSFDIVLAINDLQRYVIKDGKLVINILTDAQVTREEIFAEVERLVSGIKWMSFFNEENSVKVNLLHSDTHKLTEKIDADPYDIFGKNPSDVVTDFFNAAMTGDYETAYLLHLQGDDVIKPKLEEFTKEQQESVIYDYMVMDYIMNEIDRSAVRVQYVLDPGYEDKTILINKTYWTCIKENDIWKIEWMPEQG